MIKGILCKMFNLVPKAELELITKELDKLKEEYAALSQENAALVERNVLLENKVKDLEAENSILKTEITLLKDKVYALNELNTAIEKEKKTLALNLSNSETKVATLTKENNKLNQSSETALEQINDLGNKNEVLKSQIKEYHTICEKYREKIKNSEVEKTAEIGKLNNENQELQDKLSNLQRNTVALRDHISDLQKQNTVLEQQNKNLGQKLSDTDTKIATLTRENNKLIQSSTTALEQIKELESNLLSLQKNTANMQKDAANMQSTIYILQEENTALENEKKDLKQKLSDTDTKIATLTRENNKLIQSSATALEQVKAQDLKNDALRLQVKNLQNLNDKYSRKINEYSEKEKQQTKEHTESLETLKTEHAKTIDTLQSEIHKYQKELNEKNAITGEYELTLIKRNKEIRDVREENAELERKIQLYLKEINDAKITSNKKDEKIENLQDKLEKLNMPVKTSSDTNDSTSPENKRNRIYNKTLKGSNTPKFETTLKNLKLTEEIDIKKTMKIISNSKNNEVLESEQEIYQDPKIKFIIDKLAKINIELVYKYGKFYRKKHKRIETLKYQNLQVYNNIILLLTDGRAYAGYDMNTGKRISKPTSNKFLLLLELDDYYKNTYGKDASKKLY